MIDFFFLTFALFFYQKNDRGTMRSGPPWTATCCLLLGVAHGASRAKVKHPDLPWLGTAKDRDMINQRVYLGTMTFGWKQASSFVGKAEAAELITAFWAAGGDRLDTARIYADEPGLGEVLARCPKDTLTPLDPP